MLRQLSMAQPGCPSVGTSSKKLVDRKVSDHMQVTAFEARFHAFIVEAAVRVRRLSAVHFGCGGGSDDQAGTPCIASGKLNLVAQSRVRSCAVPSGPRGWHGDAACWRASEIFTLNLSILLHRLQKLESLQSEACSERNGDNLKAGCAARSPKMRQNR